MELFLSYIEITSFLPALQTWSVTHSNTLNVQEKVKLGFPMTSHTQNNNFVTTKQEKDGQGDQLCQGGRGNQVCLLHGIQGDNSVLARTTRLTTLVAGKKENSTHQL